MHYFLIFVFSLVSAKNAFVSTLTSDSFLLAAKVLGYSIRKYHPGSEYVLVYTEEVSNDTIDVLSHHNITTRLMKRLDGPYAATHKGNKYQYTKIHLWSLIEYEVLFHLDLDTILLDKVDEVFECGNFCASLRHSDMFNAGVFVLVPNMKVYEDMLGKMKTSESYDGGDQGFLNGYFWQVKFSEMLGYNDSKCNHKIRRLPSAYNYDVGMYYLSSKTLVTPKIIHYTLGPIKPWHWIGYPIFDLNGKWNEMRLGMHHQYGEMSSQIYGGFFSLMMSALFVIILHIALGNKRHSFRILKPAKTEIRERFGVLVSIVFVGMAAGVYNTPEDILPQLGWLHYTAYFSLTTSTMSMLYSKYRRCGHYNVMSSFILSSFIFVFHFVSWFLLASVSLPAYRYLVCFNLQKRADGRSH
ncbi:unnamed protein product [Bursaphelenchus xylophilus]|uniref:glycogenin glucosyltransferase n=1 Tax=Bursaphelenchus xylophilus TaxID=6326 RepID=A0A1I7SM95_BURXY|nr:unnamed protein product [Bursaphelenchus xylophilus]CAG9130058.1 unnamed protein product [Bursaphelenchus xylophilus]